MTGYERKQKQSFLSHPPNRWAFLIIALLILALILFILNQEVTEKSKPKISLVKYTTVIYNCSSDSRFMQDDNLLSSFYDNDKKACYVNVGCFGNDAIRR